VSVKFHNVFGLSAETVQAQPVLGWKNEETINIPFFKIMIGDVFDFFD